MSTSSVPAEVDVDAVAAAVVACPSVAHLVSGGPGEQIATYLPGRRVGGVRVDEEAVEVHVATRWDVPIPAAAAEIRDAVAPLVGGRAVTVAVDDVDDPQAALPAAGDTSPIALAPPGGTPPLGGNPMPTGAAVVTEPLGSAAVTAASTPSAPVTPPGPAGPPDAVPSPS